MTVCFGKKTSLTHTMESSAVNINVPKHEDYVDSLVAFVDILGFDSKVRAINSKDDFLRVAALLAALKATADSFDGQDPFFKDFTITAISDSVIITIPFSSPICTIAILLLIQKVQYDLMATKFKTLMRGYICRGHVYHKNQIIFGKGYSDAYKKEQAIGHAPRVVVDPQIITAGKKVVENYKGDKEKVDHIFNHLLRDASDGYYFVDYLKPLETQLGKVNKEYIEERDGVKTFVKDAIIRYQDDEGIVRKYEWLSNYISLTEHYFQDNSTTP